MNDLESKPMKRARIEENTKTTIEPSTGPSGTKVMILPSGKVACNSAICELIAVVKPFIRELVEDSNLLKMWISFMSKFHSQIVSLNTNSTSKLKGMHVRINFKKKSL